MDASPSPGLCSRCRNARVIASDRGSRFVLCELSRTDARFPRYPRLPVVDCSGFADGGDVRPDREIRSSDPPSGAA